MGLRLRSQLMIIFVGLISIALAIVAYFNIGVFRLSFLADEEQRLRYTSARVADLMLRDFDPFALTSQSSEEPPTQAPEEPFEEPPTQAPEEPFEEPFAEPPTEAPEEPSMPGEAPGTSSRLLEAPDVPGLRYVELWSPEGLVMFRSGPVSEELPGKEVLLAQLRYRPTPQHLFWDRSLVSHNPRFPYREQMTDEQADSSGAVTYEYLYPVFEPYGPPSEEGVRLRAVLHLSFQVENLSRRMGLVVGGNVLLAVTFLLTSLMAVRLWSQHAVQRPLEGLLEGMRQLDTGAHGRELASSNELINLSQTLHSLALERLKYQRELEQLNRDLEAQVEEKTKEMKEFFSLVTHDLRIPLAAIQGYCDLLKRKPEQLSERHLTYVQRASTANSHALELVRNLLEAMKIEFGTLDPVMETFDFADLAAEVSHELNVDESLPQVCLAPPADGSSPSVEADRTRIKRVLINLLSNAQQHAKETPEVTLRWNPRPGIGLEVGIEDRGPGIPEAQIERLFAKFSRIADHGQNPGGLGLGLYIVARILDSHGRKIRVQSSPEEGTVFSFSLKLVNTDA